MMKTSKAVTYQQTIVKKYDPPSCCQCSKALVPVHESMINEDRTWNVLQPDNGLILKVSGGYGMYSDPSPNERGPFFVLCGDCVNEIRSSSMGQWLDFILKELDK